MSPAAPASPALPSGPPFSSPPSGGTFGLARRARRALRRVPVWGWRALMHAVGPGERARFNVEPVTGVDYFHDIDFVGDRIRAHRLDVITPASSRASFLVGITTEILDMVNRL